MAGLLVFVHHDEGEFIDGVQPRTGSPDFLEFAKDADSTIFV